jgi:hypothetical protein
MLSGTWFLHHLLRPQLLSAAWPAFVSNEGPKTCAEAAGKIEEITGIRRCNTQVTVFLKKRGVRYRKVGSVPAGADPDEQEQFLKKNSHAENRAGQKGQALFIFQSSFLFIAGEPLWKIQGILRHKNPTTTERYLRTLGLESARDAMENNLRGPEAHPFPKKVTPSELEL